MSNKELAEELHQPIARKFEKREVHSSFRGADLVDMQLMSRFSKGLRFLLWVLICIANMHGLFL